MRRGHVTIWQAVLLQIVRTLLVVLSSSNAEFSHCRRQCPTASSVPRIKDHIAGCGDGKLRLERAHGAEFAAQSVNEVRKRGAATSDVDVLSQKNDPTDTNSSNHHFIHLNHFNSTKQQNYRAWTTWCHTNLSSSLLLSFHYHYYYCYRIWYTKDAENSPFTGVHLTTRLEMNDDIFHFEILKISCHFWNISRPI